MNNKILILYTSVGLGHKSIAENIGYYLEQAGFDVRLEDVVKANKGLLIGWAKVTYNLIAFKLPFIWRFLHNSEKFSDLALPWRTKVAGRNYKKTLTIIQEFNPDVVICTQTTASAVVSYLKQKKLYKGLFGISFSDFLVHRFWLYDNCDFYLANIEEQKRQMLALGMPADKIFVCGMTLKPQFPGDIAAVKNKLGIAGDKRVVLMGGGSLGVGFNKRLVKNIAQLPNVLILMACGKNEKLFREILAWKISNVKALGYYEPMDELYAVADLFVSKAGGLSVSEALRFYLPIIVCHTLPGQEEINLDYLLRHNLVLPRVNDLVGAIKIELSSGKFKQSLRTNEELKKLFPEPELLVEMVRSTIEKHASRV